MNNMLIFVYWFIAEDKIIFVKDKDEKHFLNWSQYDMIDENASSKIVSLGSFMLYYNNELLSINKGLYSIAEQCYNLKKCKLYDPILVDEKEKYKHNTQQPCTRDYKSGIPSQAPDTIPSCSPPSK